ncbi:MULTISPECIES: hypothetical protein [unclassified Streptomyces]|uniref:hypothetical protein n=1 Tax=unclassified Streptomyces TaxID=2593676 RepID=UPI00114D1A7F|nr:MULTISPECIES: hypothetical protein [unclassified Streptomyces]MDQ0700888.1 hypothetical protein [Streptomyces sp. W4I9-2]
MTDRDLLTIVFSALIMGTSTLIWLNGEKIASIAIAVTLMSFLWDWANEPDHGEKRPVLTVFGEIAGIIGCVIALAEFLER